MKDFDSLYFVGAGGIGMAALERYFLAKGKCIAGYDRTPSELTDALQMRIRLSSPIIVGIPSVPSLSIPLRYPITIKG